MKVLNHSTIPSRIVVRRPLPARVRLAVSTAQQQAAASSTARERQCSDDKGLRSRMSTCSYRANRSCAFGMD